MKVKIGQKWKSKNSNIILEITGRFSGNRHWNTKKIGRKNAHKIHEGTLEKFYEFLSTPTSRVGSKEE